MKFKCCLIFNFDFLGDVCDTEDDFVKKCSIIMKLNETYKALPGDSCIHFGDNAETIVISTTLILLSLISIIF